MAAGLNNPEVPAGRGKKKASEHSIGLAMAATAALLWAEVPIILKYLMGECRIETIIWFRFMSSFLALALFYLVRAPQNLSILKRPPVIGLVAGITLAYNYFAYTLGVHLTTPGNAQIIVQFAPLLLAVVGVTYFKETLHGRQKLGLALALAGFAIFYRDQITHLLIGWDIHLRGDLSLLSAALAWVTFAICQKVLLRTWTPQQTNLLIYATAAAAFTPLAHFSDFTGMTPTGWLLLIFLGANTLVAYGALAEAFNRIPAHNISVIITLNPLITLASAAALSYLDLKWLSRESITGWGYMGAVIMIMGVALVVGHRQRPIPAVVDRHG